MPVIEKNDIWFPDGPVGPRNALHKCHLSQEETEHGKAALAKNPAGYDGKVHTLIIGYNPYVYKHGGETKARCAYCNRFVSDECQKWLDSLERRK